jgi:hypothetical protein
MFRTRIRRFWRIEEHQCALKQFVRPVAGWPLLCGDAVSSLSVKVEGETVDEEGVGEEIQALSVVANAVARPSHKVSSRWRLMLSALLRRPGVGQHRRAVASARAHTPEKRWDDIHHAAASRHNWSCRRLLGSGSCRRWS